jgi:hypothetical protein
MGLGLYVTFFQAAAICGWTSTLPSSFWILLQKRWKTGARKLFLLRTRVIQSLRRDYAVRNTPLRFSHGKLVQAIALIIIVQCFLWNTHTMFPDEMPMAPEVSSVTFMFGLDQTWGMFAHPFHRSGWFVVPGKLADGSDVDLFRDGAPLSWEKPENISGMYRDERNRKYMMNLLERDRDPSKWQLGAYYCRAWNAEHPDPSKKLEAFKIIYRRAEILYDGNLGPVSSEMLWQHQCSNGLLDKWGAKISEGP